MSVADNLDRRRRAIKYFASVEIEAPRNDPKWLAKATDALRHKWKLKNEAAKRKTGNSHPSSANGNGHSNKHRELARHQDESQ
jgi:hypothetical protein